MMAHTPGPWKQLEYDDWLYIGGDDMDLIEYDPVNEPYNCEVQNAVCVIGRVDDMTERDEANAALIAAAPDLLAACDDAVQALMLLSPDCLDDVDFSLSRDELINKIFAQLCGQGQNESHYHHRRRKASQYPPEQRCKVTR